MTYLPKIVLAMILVLTNTGRAGSDTSPKSGGKSHRTRTTRELEEVYQNYLLQARDLKNPSSASLLHNMSKVSFQQYRKSESDDKNYLERVLEHSKTLIDRFPFYEERYHVMYLRGKAAKILNKPKVFLASMKACTSAKEPEIALKSWIELGDWHFKKDQHPDALDMYRKASSVLKKDPKVLSAFAQDVYQRLMWGYFRNQKLQSALDEAKNLLVHSGLKENSDLFDETMQVITESLGSNREWRNIQSYLDEFRNDSYATQIGYLLYHSPTKRLSTKGNEQLVSYLLQRSSHTAIYPQFLRDLISDQEIEIDRIEMRRKLISLIYSDNIWTKKFQDQPIYSKAEGWAINEALLLSRELYNQVQIKSSVTTCQEITRLLTLVATHQELDFSDQHRHVKCLALAGERQEAIVAATSYHNRTSDKEQIRTWLLTKIDLHEQDLLSTDQDGESSTRASKQMQLHRTVESFLMKFPNDPKAATILLTRARLHREFGEMRPARKIWSRVLLLNSSESDQMVAIRGIIFSYLEEGDLPALVSIGYKFLSLSRLSRSLERELTMVLNQAALDLLDQLKLDKIDKGQIRLLTEVATNSRLPDRERILRDSILLAGRAHMWETGLSAAQMLLTEKNATQSRIYPDLLLFKARAMMHLLRFDDSAREFLRLANSSPSKKVQARSFAQAGTLLKGPHRWAAALSAFIEAERIGEKADLANLLEILTCAEKLRNTSPNELLSMMDAFPDKSLPPRLRPIKNVLRTSAALEVAPSKVTPEQDVVRQIEQAQIPAEVKRPLLVLALENQIKGFRILLDQSVSPLGRLTPKEIEKLFLAYRDAYDRYAKVGGSQSENLFQTAVVAQKISQEIQNQLASNNIPSSSAGQWQSQARMFKTIANQKHLKNVDAARRSESPDSWQIRSALRAAKLDDLGNKNMAIANIKFAATPVSQQVGQ